jgi:hypothetical protein
MTQAHAKNINQQAIYIFNKTFQAGCPYANKRIKGFNPAHTGFGGRVSKLDLSIIPNFFFGYTLSIVLIIISSICGSSG